MIFDDETQYRAARAARGLSHYGLSTVDGLMATPFSPQYEGISWASAPSGTQWVREPDESERAFIERVRGAAARFGHRTSIHLEGCIVVEPSQP
jgi:hypothetical protein